MLTANEHPLEVFRQMDGREPGERDCQDPAAINHLAEIEAIPTPHARGF
jgi:hypothetical protein